MTLEWGLLGPEKVESTRRTRTLGVATTIRRFNELAVPGMGSVWYGKQLLFAVLGVSVAARAAARHSGRSSKRSAVTNIDAANAIEALACWMSFDAHKWARDRRMRGGTKMENRTDLSFSQVRRRSFYVTQPMRMGTVQALPALGLVDASGARFNTFSCTSDGDAFIEAAIGAFRPSNRHVLDHLDKWVGADATFDVHSDRLRDALSPIAALPPRARKILFDRILRGGVSERAQDKARRGDVLAWVEALRQRPGKVLAWDRQPAEIRSEAHWADMHAGAVFTSVRDAAIGVLDALESHIARHVSSQRFALNGHLPDPVRSKISSLREAAKHFTRLKAADDVANAFSLACNAKDDRTVIEELVSRDARVLELRGNDVVRLLPFQDVPDRSEVDDDNADPELDGSVDVTQIRWPEAISFRVKNLFLLNADLNGDLENWLDPETIIQSQS